MTAAIRVSDQPRSRIVVLDFIRMVAMVLMVQGHTLEAFLRPGDVHMDVLGWKAWMALRGLTAPLFLLVSGAAGVLGIRYEPDGRVARSLLQRRVRMGLLLIALGYLMVFPANRVADLPFLTPDIWRVFLRVNILQLNGVTLLMLTFLLARVRTVRRYATWSFGIGMAILLVSPLLQTIDWFRWLPEPAGAYVAFHHGSMFPIFPTSAYMFLGVGLGAVLKETPEARRLGTFRNAALAGGALFLAAGLGASLLPRLPIPRYDGSSADPSLALLRTGVSMVLFGGLAWLSQGLPRLAAAGGVLGRKSLVVYVGHLVLLYGTPWNDGLTHVAFHRLGILDSLPYVPLMWTLSFGGVAVWLWIQSHWGRLATTLYYSGAVALAYVLVWGRPELTLGARIEPAGQVHVEAKVPVPAPEAEPVAAPKPAADAPAGVTVVRTAGI